MCGRRHSVPPAVATDRFSEDAHFHRPRPQAGKDGLRKISQLLVLPVGALSLALLGWGQDAHGERYVLGNISDLPFAVPELGPTRRVLRLVPAPKIDHDHGHHDHDDHDHHEKDHDD